MVDTEKFVSYSGKKLEDLLNDLVQLEEYEEEKTAELEVSIDGFNGFNGKILYMSWNAPLELIPNRFIRPFLKKKIDYAFFIKFDDNSSKMTVRLKY